MADILMSTVPCGVARTKTIVLSLKLIFHDALMPLFCFSVAEQAESIDNPMHEAAKRGRCQYFY